MSNNQSNNENSAKRLEGVAMGISHFGAPSEEVGNYKSTWRKLIAYIRKYLPAIIAAIILTVAGNILQVMNPGWMSAMVDEVKNGITGVMDINAVWRIAAILIALFAGSALFGFLQNFIMATITARISKNMRSAILNKINRLPLKFFDRVSIGDVISRVTNDVDTIGQTLNQKLGMLISSVTLFIGAILMMFISNWLLAVIAIAMSMIGFLSSKAVMSRSKKYFKAQQGGIGAVNGHIEEIYSGHNIVAAYNNIENAKTDFDSINKNLYNAAWKASFVSGFITPLMNFSGSVAYVAICVGGAILAMKNVISFGVIVAFILYVNQFTQALTHIAETAPGLQSATAASERVFELLGEEELPDESGKPQSLACVKGGIVFENVRFGYSKDKTIIHGFSADIKAGQKVAIVGPTGAGKTTIVNLIMRFYDPDGGEIRIDGTPISSIARGGVHSQFGMVLQDTWLFEGTIKENIVYNKSGVTDAQVAEVIEAVGLGHYIKTLPGGYDTMLDGRLSLSEGQKQLLTIARAMIQNAPMLILDEATSSVDTRTEALIQGAMDKLMAGRTSFVIAHRLSTIKNADVILVLNEGDVVESGTHANLLEKGGFYAQLYNSQFERASIKNHLEKTP
ncbi:MAG: ABC transporter ATP-binding protein/permease [Oscillospiraceae bacterium]|jgi:ATP-binding cassette subfamily B protein|nr:ABC transporter ATP-binding protein/permease [Oscillospiraceae bacterium]